MALGRITSLHRHPVKSLGGEDRSSVFLGAGGIPGDRSWAVRDEQRGGIQGGKKIPALMDCTAQFLEEPKEGQIPAPEIRLSSGESFLADAADAASRLGACVGREVTIWPLVPAEALDHYRRAAPDDPDLEKELRAIFGRRPDEPLPDLGKFPPELMQYESPPGTYFDAFPLLLMTTNSLASMQKAHPESRFDVRRFRPNLVIDTEDDEPFPELAWAGRRLRIGGAIVRIEMECPRCVMTTHGFSDLPKDPGIMRALVEETGGNLGAYASIEEPGDVSVGDEVALL
ncbi:MAG: MOSC domain-containing protein [Deltaproteobacteria bacterium]|nr:MOSC domain-containing protein [Deltaproteobacteria bacterium]MBW2392747.1 MOSC domain-containing protein [Deltaproteobacteria bacterium]